MRLNDVARNSRFTWIGDEFCVASDELRAPMDVIAKQDAFAYDKESDVPFAQHLLGLAENF